MTPRHLSSRRALIAATLPVACALLLTACCLPGGVPDFSEEAKTCEKIKGLKTKDGAQTFDLDVDTCTWRLKALEDKPKVASCFRSCVDDARFSEDIGVCFESCELSGGAGSVKASLKIDRSNPPGGVTFKVKTKAKAKVEVLLSPAYGDPMAPKKAKADKKGKATVSFGEVKRATYNVEVTVTLGKKITKLREQLTVDTGAVEFEGISPKKGGKPVECDIALEKPFVDTIQAKGALQSDKDRLTLRFKVSGGKSISVNGQKASFKKDKAKLTLDLNGAVAELNAFTAAAAFSPRASLPFTVDAKAARIKGSLSCAVPSLSSKIIPYKQQPITFPGDLTRGNGATLLIRYDKVQEVVGDTSAKIKQVDFIAVATTREKKLSPCPYFDPNTGSNVRVDRARYDEDVTLYDRRTGKPLKSKSFTASTPGCPLTIAPGSTISEFADTTKVTAWIEATARAIK